MLDFFDQIGFENIIARNRMLSDYVKAELTKLPNVRLMTSISHDLSSPGITSFEVEGTDAWEVYSRLRNRHNIKLSTGYADGNNLIRVSTHLYNSKKDIDEMIEAMKNMMPKS